MARFGVWCGLFLAACFDLRSFSSGSIACDDRACPPGLVCSADGLCWNSDHPVAPAIDAGASIDALAPIDATPVPDAPPPFDATPRHVVSVTLTGDGAGRVVSFPAGIDCPGTCEAGFLQGATISFEAIPASWSRIEAWTGSCSTSPCSLTLDRDLGIGVELRSNAGGHNFIFITKETYPPDMLVPLVRADADCQDSAAAQGIPGQFRAWLSTAGTRAADRLGAARGWVRLDGRPFADTVADLTAGRIFYPVWFRSDGARGSTYATGTEADGSAGVIFNCSNWTSRSHEDFLALGSPSGTTSAWSYGFGSACDASFPLLCLGIDRDQPVTITPAGGRRAFLSTGTYAGGGLAGVDGICQLEATQAGFSGAFKALVASIGAAPASRFGSGSTWVRVDGVPWTSSGTLEQNRLLTTLNVTVLGHYEGPGATVGMGAGGLASGGTNGTTCDGWTSTAGGRPLVGYPSDLQGFDARTLENSCYPGNMRFYCLEE